MIRRFTTNTKKLRCHSNEKNKKKRKKTPRCATIACMADDIYTHSNLEYREKEERRAHFNSVEFGAVHYGRYIYEFFFF